MALLSCEEEFRSIAPPHRLISATARHDVAWRGSRRAPHPEDRPPSYLVHVFDTATSEYLGFSRMIRTDLYEGQTCPSTGAAFAYLPHIGYYECFKPAGD